MQREEIRVESPQESNPAAFVQPNSAAALADFPLPVGLPVQEWAAPEEDELPLPDPPPMRPAPRRKDRRPASIAPPELESFGDRRTWTSFLYLDVLLPLIAVVIVVIVLLAWIG
ncbi:MAG: hypothetical protein NVS3B21_13500 [Acidimicrobiales bacterium]